MGSLDHFDEQNVPGMLANGTLPPPPLELFTGTIEEYKELLDAYQLQKELEKEEKVRQAIEHKFESQVYDSMMDLKVRQEAERRLGALNYTGTVELTWADLEEAHQTYIVQDFIPDDSVCFLVAKPNLGKTFTYIDMVCSLVTGLDWLGKATRQVKTLIVLGEGRNGYIDRIKAWCDAKGKTLDDLKGWLYFIDGANLNNDESLERIQEVLDREGIELAVWDTWANVSGVTKEEDNGLNNETMRRVLAVRPGMTNFFVHHPRKAEEDSDAPVMRGAGSLNGRADVVMTMWADKSFIASTGQKHEFLALSTEVSHKGKNRTAQTETIRGLFLQQAGDNKVFAQIHAEAISKEARGVKEKLLRPMTVKEYADSTGMTEDTARRHLGKAVKDGIAEVEKGPTPTSPDVFKPLKSWSHLIETAR